MRRCLVVCAFALSSSGVAQADETHECATAAYAGQRLRDDGKLASARARLVECASPRCPALVVADCTRWLADVDARVPTVVLAAHDAAGADMLNVHVSIDGRGVSDTLDGRAVPVDVGPHTFRFEARGSAPVETSIIAREGEKGRSVSVVLRPPAPPPVLAPAPPPRPDTAERRSGLPWPAAVGAGVTVVALAGFVGFGLSGRAQKNELADTCAPAHACSASDVDAARTKLVVADVALGVAVLALGATVYVLLRDAR